MDDGDADEQQRYLNNNDKWTQTSKWGLQEVPVYQGYTLKPCIQYHMQQIMEKQKVVDKYRSMMEDRIDLTPLESNSYKSDPVVVSQIIHVIELHNFWHQKTLEVVLADL